MNAYILKKKQKKAGKSAVNTLGIDLPSVAASQAWRAGIIKPSLCLLSAGSWYEDWLMRSLNSPALSAAGVEEKQTYASVFMFRTPLLSLRFFF